LGLVINKAKTPTVVFGNDNIDQPVEINDYTLKNVTQFKYLGSVFSPHLKCVATLPCEMQKSYFGHLQQ